LNKSLSPFDVMWVEESPLPYSKQDKIVNDLSLGKAGSIESKPAGKF